LILFPEFNHFEGLALIYVKFPFWLVF